jgi:large subunit ribosomal protein L33
MATKSKTVKVKLVSESGYFYTTLKNPKMAHKLKLRKYDPKTRKHEWFEEKKIK